MSTHKSILGGVLVLAGLLVASALLSQTDPDAARRARETGSPAVAISPSEHLMSSWLIQDNQNEVALAEIALKKATNEEVKQFARTMVEDHRAMISTLRPFTTPRVSPDAKPASDLPPGENPPGSDPSDRRSPSPKTSTERAPGTGPVDVIALKEELGRQCLASLKKEFEQKSGAELNRCFVFQQLGAHMQAVDTLTVFKNHAAGQFRDVLTEALSRAQSHLESAKSLARKCEEAHAPSSN